jgi:hypothetical protein
VGSMEISNTRDGFARHLTPAVVPGNQPKLALVLPDGVYVVGQTELERYERWLMCEDLAKQLVSGARRDRASHPEKSPAQTLERVQKSVGRKHWVSPDELAWLMHRLRTFLDW